MNDPLTNKEERDLDKMVSAEIEDWQIEKDLLHGIAEAMGE